MAEHATSGIKFAGRVSQLITASTGFDDWEWGVTLWARAPEHIKEIVYTMRFDRASARYAEFGPERADVEIGFPVAALAADLPALRSDDTLGSTELPGGEAAEYRHVGPYPELGTAYRAIEAWFGASGRSAGGAPWESYEVGFADVGGDASRLETLVLWPLA